VPRYCIRPRIDGVPAKVPGKKVEKTFVYFMNRSNACKDLALYMDWR